MRVILVRHGQTAWNASNLAQGHTDIELDAVGHSQAEVLAGRLTRMGVERILTSDLVRCRQTVAPFARRMPHLEVEPRTELRERTFGEMEGQDYSILHGWMRKEAARLAVPDREIRPPGGESMDDVWARLETIESLLRTEERTTLVVSHGGALAQLLSKLIRAGREAPRAFRFQNCGVTELTKRADGFFVFEVFNDGSHLEAPVEVA